MKKLAIATLSYNGADKLKNLRPGLQKNIEKLIQTNNIDSNYKWIIRDNGSSDNTKEIIKDWREVCSLFITHNRDNFSQGINSLNNLYKNYDILLLLNNDVGFPDNNSLLEMITLFNDPDVSVVGARLLYPNTNKGQHFGVILSNKYNQLPYHFRHKEISDKNTETNRYFQAVTAAVCMVRVRDFFEAEQMDEKYCWGYEDIDLCFKIGKILGKKIAYCGKTVIYHEESSTMNKLGFAKLFMPQNIKYFKEKWSGKYQIDHQLYLDDPNYNLIK